VLSGQEVYPDEALIRQVGEVVNLKDAPIVAAAMHGRADYLATHDVKTLLRFRQEIQTQFGIEMVEPQEILFKLRTATN
jgi:predicted nucleic acid-binding protein